MRNQDRYSRIAYCLHWRDNDPAAAPSSSGGAMTSDWRVLLAQQSTAAVAQFVAANPDFSADAHQPDYRGGTNYVTFGRYGQQPIVFKYFVRKERWQNEQFCLQHFASTGYVPLLLASVPDQLLVMTRLA